ncbi:MAG: DUF4876 domain-containing protein [Candidatus Marinimicrobia bacterium]|nr:DUF4876 domain-containing protein [Candidatus Neomarinimicrobiota bacterium]
MVGRIKISDYIVVKEILLIVCLCIFTFNNCSKEEPLLYDGNLDMIFFVSYLGKPAKNIHIRLKSLDFNIDDVRKVTDTNGYVEFYDLIYSRYIINVSDTIYYVSDITPGEVIKIHVIGSKIVEPDSFFINDTLELLKENEGAGLKINEIYVSGAKSDNFYFYDQFIELYNSSEDTLYLDGMIVCRVGNINSVKFIFRFPGESVTGRQYPVPPHSFVVLAHDAYDHTKNVESSVDLSNADWEFRNSLDVTDWDNEDVPNIDNIEEGYERDFLLSLTNDVVLIADGTDINYLDGIDPSTVIDCVEYSNNSDYKKRIEKFLDAGFAGIGMVAYSGKSLERVSPGFDTNNSALDFVLIDRPTPGCHYQNLVKR